ncbi:hypothetical protein [Mesorhizobium sp. M0633]|uniref:hypothetical protein n=1 Tax=Mesorhizobium sp. M0633 TaxID=2956977 RepID=UPI00333AAA30
MSAADLGLRVGEPVEIIVDLIAAQSLQIIGSIAVSSGVAHNESNTVNPAVAGGLGYMSVGLTVTPTQNDVTFGSRAAWPAGSLMALVPKGEPAGALTRTGGNPPADAPIRGLPA